MPGEEEVKTVAPAKTDKKVPKEGEAIVEEEKKGGEPPKKAAAPKIGKMKTREGDSTKLMALLDEAKQRTLDIFHDRMKEVEGED